MKRDVRMGRGGGGGGGGGRKTRRDEENVRSIKALRRSGKKDGS